MPEIKVTKAKSVSSRKAPVSSGSLGIFTPVVPLVRLPFILMQVFTDRVSRLFGFAPRGETAPKNKNVREISRRTGMKSKSKAA